MIFKRPVQRYGQTPEPETPYSRAGQLWDERIGSARVQAHNWRLMALGGLFLSSGLASALVWQSLQSRVTPYVVAVDRLGEAQAVTPAQAEYQPTDPQIAWGLAKFIANVREVSLDPVLVRKHWLEAYDFASPKGAIFLNDYARSSDPFAAADEKSVSVEITSVVRASDISFQVKWIEMRYERGNLVGTSHWTAILAVKQVTPKSVDILRKNPLGIYVDAIAWSREFESTAPPVVAEKDAAVVADDTALDPGIQGPAVPSSQTGPTPTDTAPITKTERITQ